MECPKCGLISPESAQRCDCGYDFVTDVPQKPTTVAERASEPREKVSDFMVVAEGNKFRLKEVSDRRKKVSDFIDRIMQRVGVVIIIVLIFAGVWWLAASVIRHFRGGRSCHSRKRLLQSATTAGLSAWRAVAGLCTSTAIR